MHGVSYHGKEASETTSFGCMWPGLSFNQIAGFFDQQDYKKEPIIVYNFLHGDNHQGKVAYKTTTFGWVLPGLSLIQLDYKIIRSTACLEGIK